MRRFLVLLAVVLAVAACTPDPAAPPKAPGPKVADLWRDFPVTSALDRPLIVLDPLPLADEAARGRVPASAALSAVAPPSRQLTVQGLSRYVTLTSARDALAAIRSQTAHAALPEARVTGTELTVSAFSTDRGPVELPAWEFRLAEGGTIWWPALTASHFWRLGSIVPSTLVSDLSVDGRTVSATFTVSWGMPCPGTAAPRIVPTAVEHPSFVSIGLKALSSDMGDCDQRVAAPLTKATLTLKEPLGNRVVVDFAGRVVPGH
ncbi:hypothetical protein [Herbidospora sp. NBRC 101105]|uniref:hypothetical protein n=1 Tax=Herbidospora sp. NBRC 101105 TaxID=3032195 RepID=UPI0024A26B9D|nr:hypothetical protein [Herbidospora sp. NBRC 101105]GLX94417.1 hypothetical protein Hesp01_23670 [Herbidospora sp. NBRC 101105]